MALLTFSNLKTDLLRMAGSKSSSARDDITSAVTSAIYRAGEEFCQYGDWGFLEKFTDRVYIPLAAPYSTGTVAVTQDSKTITGTGTTWTKDMEGSFICFNSTEFYEIRSWTSTTVMTLSIPFQGTTSSSYTYVIYKRFYPLPLNFLRPIAEDAKISQPGTGNETYIAYSDGANFTDKIISGIPSWFGISGNTRNSDYYNTGTITIATVGTTSTWTVSSGTLPTDIVDREVRVNNETRSYYIDSRLSATTFTTYNTYVNPSDATSTLATASSYAITPVDTQLIGFSNVPSQRYIFSMPYIKTLDEMILDNDVSPIVRANYGSAYLALCRRKLAEDARTAMRGDTVQSLIAASIESMANAWLEETSSASKKRSASFKRLDRAQRGPSWITG